MARAFRIVFLSAQDNWLLAQFFKCFKTRGMELSAGWGRQEGKDGVPRGRALEECHINTHHPTHNGTLFMGRNTGLTQRWGFALTCVCVVSLVFDSMEPSSWRQSDSENIVSDKSFYWRLICCDQCPSSLQAANLYTACAHIGSWLAGLRKVFFF